MKGVWGLTAFIVIGTIACASPQPRRVIEPDSPGAELAVDSTVVLSKKSDLADDEARARFIAQFPVHIQEKWWPFRAEHLRISEQQARERDAKMSVASAPSDFWDRQTAVEAATIWIALCNECHGGRRRVKDAVSMPAPRPNWGQGSGLFFGKRRPYAEIFGIISNGGPPREDGPSEMPVWQDKLSREQIWSMIYFLEFQSGGIEGTFPPSLYPRGGGD